MINDFEVGKVGYLKEIELSRKLAHSIDECLKDPKCPVPLTILHAYQRLKMHYDWQIENGVQ